MLRVCKNMNLARINKHVLTGSHLGSSLEWCHPRNLSVPLHRVTNLWNLANDWLILAKLTGCAIPLGSIPCLLFWKTHWALALRGGWVFLVLIRGFLGILHYSTQSLRNTKPMRCTCWSSELTFSSCSRSSTCFEATSCARKRLMVLVSSGSKMFPSSSLTTRSKSRILEDQEFREERSWIQGVNSHGQRQHSSHWADENASEAGIYPQVSENVILWRCLP